MNPAVLVLTIVSSLLELLKQSHESGVPLTQEQVDAVISDRRAASAENAALDP